MINLVFILTTPFNTLLRRSR